MEESNGLSGRNANAKFNLTNFQSLVISWTMGICDSKPSFASRRGSIFRTFWETGWYLVPVPVEKGRMVVNIGLIFGAIILVAAFEGESDLWGLQPRWWHPGTLASSDAAFTLVFWITPLAIGHQPTTKIYSSPIHSPLSPSPPPSPLLAHRRQDSPQKGITITIRALVISFTVAWNTEPWNEMCFISWK